MRRVQYYPYIPKRLEQGSSWKIVPGTGQQSTELKEGFFVAWGLKEGESGSITAAIVETPTGHIELVEPHCIQFLDLSADLLANCLMAPIVLENQQDEEI